MATDNEYILFLDESSVTRYNPYLLLGGIIISRSEYKKFLIPKIHSCKTILDDPYIVFHYTDMLKGQGDFLCLRDQCKRDKFWHNLYCSLDETNFTIVASYTDLHKNKFQHPNSICNDSYELLFATIINNYIHFLYTHHARGSIVFESREETQNKHIQQYYFHILKHGTNVYKSTAIEKYITTTSFLVKEENCIGLQIADLVAYNCIKHINQVKVKHNMWDILGCKIYDGCDNNIENYGLVKLF